MRGPKLSDFAGEWRIERQIKDHLAGDTLKFSGTASFTPEDDALRYLETGILQRSGQADMTASQRYLWRQTEGGIEVFFADGRFFHRLESAEQANAVHDCPPDFYRVAYDFSDFSRWNSRWRVTGPRKDYEMTSVYCRAAA